MRARTSASCAGVSACARGERAAHPEHGADLGHQVVARGDADQLDDVHARQVRLAGQHHRDPGLADAARAQHRREPARREGRAQAGQVGLATEQLVGVVAQSRPHRRVGRQQLLVHAAGGRDPGRRRAGRRGRRGTARSVPAPPAHPPWPPPRAAAPPGRVRRPAGRRARITRAASASTRPAGGQGEGAGADERGPLSAYVGEEVGPRPLSLPGSTAASARASAEAAIEAAAGSPAARPPPHRPAAGGAAAGRLRRRRGPSR